MSLEPEWYSTIYGTLVLTGQGLAALAFAIIMLSILSKLPPLSAAVEPQHFHDLGNLLLMFILLWAYMSFSQFLVIWSGNLPHEVTWYLHRGSMGWKLIAGALAAFHFFAPFLILLFRKVKRHPGRLAIVAGLLFFLQMIHIYWLVIPALRPDGVQPHVCDLAAPLGIGGLWIGAFLWNLGRYPLVPESEEASPDIAHALPGGAV